MSGEDFDFEAERERWPEHWERDEKGWPTVGSRWRARRFPQLRIKAAWPDANRTQGVADTAV
jgi:hypothetical protein